MVSRRLFPGLIALGLALAACAPAAPAQPPSAAQPTAAPAAQSAPAATTAPAAAAPAATTAPAAQPAGGQKTLLVGAALPLTGDVAPDGNGQKDGYDLWKDTVNAAGGIDVGGTKYQVDIRYYDYKSDTTTAVKLIEKLITEDKVQFLFAPFGSGATEAAAAVSEKYQIPMLAPSANAAPIYTHGYKYIFGILGPAVNFGEAAVQFLLQQQPAPKTMAIIARNDLAPLNYAKAFESAAKNHNIDVQYFEQFPIGVSDLSTPLLGAKAKNPDILVGTGYINDLALMTKQAKELQVNPKVFIQADGPANQPFIDATKADGNYLMTPVWWTAVAKYQDQTKLFDSAADYDKKFQARFGRTPGYVSAAATAVGEVLQEAIKKSGTVEPTKVRDALAATDLQSFYGPIKFNEQGQNIGSPVVLLQIQDQKLVAVSPENTATAKVQYPMPAWDKR